MKILKQLCLEGHLETIIQGVLNKNTLFGSYHKSVPYYEIPNVLDNFFL